MESAKRKIVQYVRGHDHIHPGGIHATESLCVSAGIPKGALVLDVGSGFGGPSDWMTTNLGAHVLGIDVLIENCKIALRKSSTAASFLCADAEHLPIVTNSIDAIVSWCVLGFIENKKAALKEFFRVLRRKGVFAADVYTVLDAERFQIRPQGPRFILPMEEYTSLFTDNGFEILCIEDISKAFTSDYKHLLNLFSKKEHELNTRFGRTATTSALAEFMENIAQVLDHTKGGLRIVAKKNSGILSRQAQPMSLLLKKIISLSLYFL